MNAPPFPIAPQVGEFFGNWVWNGARWVATPTTGLRVLNQTFGASGPYMPSPGLVSLIIECIGGGGSGGGAGPSPGTQYILGGGGGGSGGYSKRTLPGALVRGGVLVTVGQGGSHNGDGGTTSFGALCVAYGGHYGEGNDATTVVGSGGQGADRGVGDHTWPGSPGNNGIFQVAASGVVTAAGGRGGEVMTGAGLTNVGSGASVAGIAGADGTGAGGEGACVNQDPNPGALSNPWGGDGASGVCYVTEFCWGDRDQPFTEVPTFNLNANLVMGPPHLPGPCGPPRPPGPWPREIEPWEDPNAFSDS